MINKILLFIFIFLLIFFSCSDLKKNETNRIISVDSFVYTTNKVKLEKIKEICTVKYKEFTKFFYQDNRLYLVNSKNDILSISSVNNKNSKEVIYPVGEICKKQGFLSNYGCFHIHNLDSIFLLNRDGYEILLIDKESKLINKWKIKEDMNKILTTSGLFSTNIIFKNNYLSIFGVPKKKLSILLNENVKILNKERTGMVYLLEEFGKYEFKHFIGKMPEMYCNGDNYYFPYPKKTINNKNEIIYSYLQDDSLRIYNFFTGEFVKNVEAKSRYINKFNSMKDLENVENINKYIIDYIRLEPKYSGIIYDNYNKLYYRTAKHRIEFIENAETINYMFYYLWSMIILDENFNYIDEIVFNNKKLLMNFNAFITTKNGFLGPFEKVEDKNIFSLYKITLKR